MLEDRTYGPTLDTPIRCIILLRTDLLSDAAELCERLAPEHRGPVAGAGSGFFHGDGRLM